MKIRYYFCGLLLCACFSLMSLASPEKWITKVEAHIEFQLYNEKQTVVNVVTLNKVFHGTLLRDGCIAICADLLPDELIPIKHVKSVKELKINKITWACNGKECQVLGYNRDRRILFLQSEESQDGVISSEQPQKGMRVRSVLPTPLGSQPSYFVENQELNSVLKEPSYYLCNGQPGMPILAEKRDELMGVIAIVHQVTDGRGVLVLIPAGEMLEDIQTLQEEKGKQQEGKDKPETEEKQSA